MFDLDFFLFSIFQSLSQRDCQIAWPHAPKNQRGTEFWKFCCRGAEKVQIFRDSCLGGYIFKGTDTLDRTIYYCRLDHSVTPFKATESGS